MTTFLDLGLAEPITRALASENYATPTPIQLQTIPIALSRRDVIGIAQTGTGKTAAFALPILHHLAADRRPAARKSCRALVLSPTRELSGQILDSFQTYGRYLDISGALVIGGVPMGGQVRSLLGGVDVLVATPGRLLDLVHGNALKLNDVEFLVLDEADRMLDMGFIHDIRKIVSKLPAQRQTMLFSATMPQAIAELASRMLRDPVQVAVTPVASTVERIAQRVIHVDAAAKHSVLIDLLRDEAADRALVFTRTKHRADVVVRRLSAAGIAAAAIHGNKSQNNRDRALAGFRDGRVRTLVATDIAARGIDVDGITHVVNFDLPHVPDTYVHRIGRTGRAGADGTAVSLCDADEVALLRDIEKLIRKSIPSSSQRSASPSTARHVPDHAGHRGRPSQPSRAKRKGRDGRPAFGHPQQNGSAGVAFLNGGGKSDNRQQFRRRRRRKPVAFDRAQAGG
ncbi:MAG: DEAD/DEAH box helicase [Xanthobacteraceae bacterium]|nr:DEAD/DEAH box helicase [Xanthobacteraceae bacterium]